MGVSKNRGTPKSSILMGFSIINHPFWGTPIFGNTHMPGSSAAYLFGMIKLPVFSRFFSDLQLGRSRLAPLVDVLLLLSLGLSNCAVGADGKVKTASVCQCTQKGPEFLLDSFLDFINLQI